MNRLGNWIVSSGEEVKSFVCREFEVWSGEGKLGEKRRGIYLKDDVAWTWPKVPD